MVPTAFFTYNKWLFPISADRADLIFIKSDCAHLYLSCPSQTLLRVNFVQWISSQRIFGVRLISIWWKAALFVGRMVASSPILPPEEMKTTHWSYSTVCEVIRQYDSCNTGELDRHAQHQQPCLASRTLRVIVWQEQPVLSGIHWSSFEHRQITVTCHQQPRPGAPPRGPAPWPAASPASA